MHLQPSYKLAIYIICTCEKFIRRLKGVYIQNFFKAILNCVFSFLRLAILLGKLLKIWPQSRMRLSENKAGWQPIYEMVFTSCIYVMHWRVSLKFSWFSINKTLQCIYIYIYIYIYTHTHTHTYTHTHIYIYIYWFESVKISNTKLSHTFFIY
jgi:hypothetical protein